MTYNRSKNLVKEQELFLWQNVVKNLSDFDVYLSLFSMCCPSFTLFCRLLLFQLLCHLQQWNKCPLSYPLLVIRIPHFLWLGTGGAVSWDRWETDWNNWCKHWNLAPRKQPLFLEMGDILAEACSLNGKYWAFRSKIIGGMDFYTQNKQM